MKKLWLTIVVIAIAVGVFLLLKSKKTSELNPPTRTETASENISNTSSNQAKTQTAPSNRPAIPSMPVASASTELAARAASPNAEPIAGADTNAMPDLPPAVVLDKTRILIHNYHDSFGENPVGTNPEITEALKGKNPKQINFIADSGLRVNDKGELIDGYGTPFFFHQISGQEMEIRSAGPDHVMWTADDLVTK